MRPNNTQDEDFNQGAVVNTYHNPVAEQRIVVDQETIDGRIDAR